uniref:Uncharacterized protein n=1 Tax=Grammatophora oceanica TaxID=210454 RepID=A0A7S1UWS2_9STRA|mmetsp:Transcript_27052/g.39578  ORF Transcript_27052/g.39578 Transcript_27052/m.39578 type:complete len:381 (+) Transcript_27052:82-1224(+)
MTSQTKTTTMMMPTKTLHHHRHVLLPFLLLLLPSSLCTVSAQTYANQTGEFSSCGGCHCIPDNDGADPCPTATKPETKFTVQHVDTLLSLNHTNPFTIDCDPYTNATCETVPARDPLTQALDPNAVCAFLYDYPEQSELEDEQPCPLSYSAKTFASREEATAAGYVVTHEGGCATCSTTQDLAIYMTVIDQRQAATQCAFDALRSFELGKRCFMENIGFTEACSIVWTYDTLNTNNECGAICAAIVIGGQPNNGPEPTCTLNECLECNEVQNGPGFKGFAGRTRRNSGILSAIARPCSSIASVEHLDPCLLGGGGSDTPSPTTKATPSPTTKDTPSPTTTTAPPTSSPTSSGGATSWASIIMRFVSHLLVVGIVVVGWGP